MKNIGFMFSGQGAQYIEMGKDLYENYSEVKEAFDNAQEIVGFDLKGICFNGPKEKLDSTDVTQVAIFTLSAGIFNVLKNRGIKSSVCCGLSLGEYSALYASGIITFEEGVKLLKLRGEIMANAYPKGKGTMTAVIGLSKEDVEECIEKVKVNGVVEIANLNCPSQIVVTGEVEAIEKAEEEFKANKAMKVVRLDVSGPFHSSLLKDASLDLKKELEKIDFKKPSITVLTNYTGDVINEETLVDTLTGQMCSTVYFEDNIRKMIDLNVDTFVEIGPGKALSGFVKRVDRKKKILNIENVEGLEAFVDYINE
ncbi:MAG: ACP S-malonyltransferase [Clostridium sp.]|uniref:ACP S-malonyltransferase n=1 Tax=Clostridium sp. TaxID=1506 RepID=UPI002FC7D206